MVSIYDEHNYRPPCCIQFFGFRKRDYELLSATLVKAPFFISTLYKLFLTYSKM